MKKLKKTKNSNRTLTKRELTVLSAAEKRVSGLVNATMEDIEELEEERRSDAIGVRVRR